MKPAAIGLLAGFVAGLGAAALLVPAARAAAPPPSASPPVPAAAPDVSDLEEVLQAEQAAVDRLRRLAADPGARAEARARSLEERKAGLVEKRDGPGLMALARELAALGEPGFPGAARVLQLVRARLADLEWPEGYSWPPQDLADALLPLTVWAFRHADAVSAEFRIEMIRVLGQAPGFDARGEFLKALDSERDPAAVEALAGCLCGHIDDASLPALLASARRHGADPAAARAFLSTLSFCPTPAAVAAIAELARDPSEHLRAEARVALRAVDPPRPGVWIGSRLNGFEPGDIVVSVDGQDLVSRDQLTAGLRRGAVQLRVVVDRDGTLVTVTTERGLQGLHVQWVEPRK